MSQMSSDTILMQQFSSNLLNQQAARSVIDVNNKVKLKIQKLASQSSKSMNIINSF